MQIVGKQLSDGFACAVHITAEEVREALEPIIDEIVTGIRRVIEDAQPEAVADIYYSGMILTGGGSMLKGLKESFADGTETSRDDAGGSDHTVVMGAGILLD